MATYVMNVIRRNEVKRKPKSKLKRVFKAKSFKNWLDDLCKNIVKVRDNRTCQKCYKVIHDTYDCQWAHIKSRSRNDLRWDMNNSMVLCGSCHQWWHANPNEAGVWFANTFPARDEYINSLIYNATVWKQVDFERIEEYLLGKCKDLNVKAHHLSKAYQKRYEEKVQNGY